MLHDLRVRMNTDLEMVGPDDAFLDGLGQCCSTQKGKSYFLILQLDDNKAQSPQSFPFTNERRERSAPSANEMNLKNYTLNSQR